MPQATLSAVELSPCTITHPTRPTATLSSLATMGIFSLPTSFRLANLVLSDPSSSTSTSASSLSNGALTIAAKARPHSSHPPLDHLILLVFEAVLEVVCVSLPGYIVARQGMFDADMQKFVANLNVALFTPCLIFTKLASQLTASKLAELAVIPIIFAVQIGVSYLCSIGMSRLFRLQKRPSNFVVAMGVFGNSNSLPISLVISLSQTLKGLHWDKIPGDNDDEVAARGILYLLIFQQLGQLVRWSWGYHVLLAPPESFEGEPAHTNGVIERGEGSYRDEVDSDEDEGLIDVSASEDHGRHPRGGVDGGLASVGARRGQGRKGTDGAGDVSRSDSDFESGDETPVTREQYTSSVSSRRSGSNGHAKAKTGPGVSTPPANGNGLPHDTLSGHITSFPTIRSRSPSLDSSIPAGPRGWIPRAKLQVAQAYSTACSQASDAGTRRFERLSPTTQGVLSMTYTAIGRFLRGLWDFMNPPLWAMLAAIIVASIPALQRLFFTEGTFIQNSVTRAVSQSGGVAIPLILVVLGANLARNTLPADPAHSPDDEKLEKKLLIACIVSRMLLPTIIMAPMLALAAKYVPISILDDPIFVIVCFLLTGAPSALQLAQICQINGVYEGVMAKLLFQSYVIW